MIFEYLVIFKLNAYCRYISIIRIELKDNK